MMSLPHHETLLLVGRSTIHTYGEIPFRPGGVLADGHADHFLGDHAAALVAYVVVAHPVPLAEQGFAHACGDDLLFWSIQTQRIDAAELLRVIPTDLRVRLVDSQEPIARVAQTQWHRRMGKQIIVRHELRQRWRNAQLQTLRPQRDQRQNQTNDPEVIQMGHLRDALPVGLQNTTKVLTHSRNALRNLIAIEAVQGGPARHLLDGAGHSAAHQAGVNGKSVGEG